MSFTIASRGSRLDLDGMDRLLMSRDRDALLYGY